MLSLNQFRNIFRPLRTEPLSLLGPNGVRSISHSAPLAFNLTPCLMAMPVKRRRRIDPMVLKLREDRKKRKIEKEIRNLEKLKKVLKPIEEARMPYVLYENKEARKRPVEVPADVRDYRILMYKEWSKIRLRHSFMEKIEIQNIMKSQMMALEELSKESQELYEAAIQMDPNLVPFTFKGPTETPPIEGYEFPDGEYTDISKDWLEEYKKSRK